MMSVKIYDSTLRDGAQAEGISFSVSDKLRIAQALDALGVSYIEAGNPFSNPKDLEFFQKVKELHLSAKLVAFGSTRKRGVSVEEDKNLMALLEAKTEAVAIVGKSWDLHVTEILRAELPENLQMIQDTVAFLKKQGLEVIFDAEHFFDGFKDNQAYALETLKAAARAGVDCLCLCDTNGGTFPNEIVEIIQTIKEELKREGLNPALGIHCHNDCGMAVAGSCMAVEAGASQVQGTLVGFGERCGNANLSTIIPNLQLKKNFDCIPQEKIAKLTETAILISEISNLTLLDREPYVGRSAFTHKGGMHVDGVSKLPKSFEHIEPGTVGNERRILTSEVAGKSTILSKIQKIEPNLQKDSPETEAIISRLKALEYEGYQFEAAESTFELLIKKMLGKYKPQFELVHLKIIGEQPYVDGQSASALIKIRVDDKIEITAAEGNGPVNALDQALRKALEVFYPQIANIQLTDYKVRVLDNLETTASKVRVLIESTDGHERWSSVGVSKDIIEASWIALVDSIEYKLLKNEANE